MSVLSESVRLLDEVGPALSSPDDRAGLVALCAAARTGCDPAAASVAVFDDDIAELV